MVSRAHRVAAMVRAHVSGESIPHVPGTFGAVIDTREQAPFVPHVSIPWVVRALPAGDYSAIGHETEIAVERKSLADLVGSVTVDNARFQRELAKLATYRFAAVVIEASQREVLRGHRFSRVPGDRVLATCATLEAKFRVPFHFAGDRSGAHLWTFTLLEAAFRRAQGERQRAATTALEANLMASNGRPDMVAGATLTPKGDR